MGKNKHWLGLLASHCWTNVLLSAFKTLFSRDYIIARAWSFSRCKSVFFSFSLRCSRKHNYPNSSQTLLIRGMFVTFGMEQCKRDDYDTDASLEYSEEEIYQQFLDFYEDVLPEFKNVGKVVQFKVWIYRNILLHQKQNYSTVQTQFFSSIHLWKFINSFLHM